MPSIHIAILMPALLAWTALAAVIAGRSPARRALAFAAALAGLAAPFAVVPAHPIARGITALGAALYFFRIVDLLTMRAHGWSATRRIAHAISLIDSRLLRRARPHIAWRWLLDAALYGIVTAASLAIVGSEAPHLAGTTGTVVRWFAGAVFVYCSIEVGQHVARTLYAALGFDTPSIHDAPIRSTTVAEFWGQRWNRPVSGWLREHCFRPLARRRLPFGGIAAAFVASAALHAYLAVAALGAMMAAWSAAFFVAQIPLMVIESRAQVRRWPLAAARTWTVIAVLCSSPLQVEPMLRAVLPSTPGVSVDAR